MFVQEFLQSANGHPPSANLAEVDNILTAVDTLLEPLRNLRESQSFERRCASLSALHQEHALKTDLKIQFLRRISSRSFDFTPDNIVDLLVQMGYPSEPWSVEFIRHRADTVADRIHQCLKETENAVGLGQTLRFDTDCKALGEGLLKDMQRAGDKDNKSPYQQLNRQKVVQFDELRTNIRQHGREARFIQVLDRALSNLVATLRKSAFQMEETFGRGINEGIRIAPEFVTPSVNLEPVLPSSSSKRGRQNAIDDQPFLSQTYAFADRVSPALTSGDFLYAPSPLPEGVYSSTSQGFYPDTLRRQSGGYRPRGLQASPVRQNLYSTTAGHLQTRLVSGIGVLGEGGNGSLRGNYRTREEPRLYQRPILAGGNETPYRGLMIGNEFQPKIRYASRGRT